MAVFVIVEPSQNIEPADSTTGGVDSRLATLDPRCSGVGTDDKPVGTDERESGDFFLNSDRTQAEPSSCSSALVLSSNHKEKKRKMRTASRS